MCALVVLHYHIYNTSDRRLARTVWDMHKTVSFSTDCNYLLYVCMCNAVHFKAAYVVCIYM